ncbi:glycoside hydrolase family protein [Paenibacillus sp. MBLB4367]|uniref:glycoside hydrolase family protein n=1 Tax=Paenibacillus sp. MBLB4367 TaxID=3384767 RepID=UPI0039081931
MGLREIGRTIGFSDVLEELGPDNVFGMPGWHVWCGSAVRGGDGLYYLFFSRWPEEAGFEAWVTHSEIGLAVSEWPAGPYRFVRTLFDGNEADWDRVTHNPAVLEHKGKYYLYYMGTNGRPNARHPGLHDVWWTHRNNQRIGVAEAKHPAGPWRRMKEPVLDVTPGSWDGLMTSNPSVCTGRDGQIVMMYKGVAEGPLPKGGAVNAGTAFAVHPAGPFVKRETPDIANPEHPWAVEDPCIWFEDGRYLALMKDFQGYFTKGEPSTIALLESDDGENWKPCPKPLAMRRELRWSAGRVQSVHRLERPQLLLENGRPVVCFLAVLETPEARSYSVHIPLRLIPR